MANIGIGTSHSPQLSVRANDWALLGEQIVEAIQNVFALAVKRDPEIREFNPLVLWDLHYVKEVDDSGYVRQLYM